MANIYGVVALDAAQHKGYSDFVQHTNPLKEGLLQTLSTDNLLNSLNSVDSTESVNPLIQLNCSESREMANSLKSLQAPNSGFARRLGNLLEIQKEKGSSANAAFEMTAFLLHEENQNVNRLSFSESDNSPLLRRLVLRNPLRVAQMHTEIIGQAIPTTIGGWDLSLCESISPAQTLHTEIIGTKNLQVTKRHPQNNPEIIGAVGSITHSKPVQPFSSMLRDFNSLRITRLSQAEIDSSPSTSIACFMAFSSAGSTLKAICLFPRGNFVFDMCLTQWLSCLCLTMYNTSQAVVKQRSPEVLPTRSGLLTTNAKATSEAAMNNHITPLNGRNSLTLNKFTWRFLALNRHDIKAKPCRLSVEATTEHEARRILAPHFILSFAARLPVQEVHHA